ncbi:MAG: DUF6174 domain-containing protein [bacterium]
MPGHSLTSRIASLALVFVLGGGACRSATEPQLDLVAARALWTSLAPAAYEITILRTCECLPEMSGPVTVVVRNGIVEWRHYVQSGATVANAYADAFPTVSGLFSLLDEAARNGTQPVSVQFDPRLGYPVHIVIGDPATDSPVYDVSAFRAL